jgi:hypothetical protein
LGWHYYKNVSKRSLLSALNIDATFDYWWCQFERRSCDLYFVGRKRGGNSNVTDKFSAWIEPRDSFFQLADADLPTTALNIVASYLEQLGLKQLPLLRFHFVQKLRALKKQR